FDIDANGIMHVSAKDKATAKEQSIRITSSSGLNKDEIDKMKNQAKEHAAEDKKKKESVDIKNSADNLVFQTKKQIEELKDKLPADVKSKLEAEIVNVEDAIKTNNTDTIKAATDKLNKIWSEAAQNLYQQPSAQGQPGNGFDPNAQQQSNAKSEAPKDSEKNVEDASYEVVDDDK
ncbi:MAG: Hsp70 family protein, partial [Melioribacteraceae bacterium]